MPVSGSQDSEPSGSVYAETGYVNQNKVARWGRNQQILQHHPESPGSGCFLLGSTHRVTSQHPSRTHQVASGIPTRNAFPPFMYLVASCCPFKLQFRAHLCRVFSSPPPHDMLNILSNWPPLYLACPTHYSRLSICDTCQFLTLSNHLPRFLSPNPKERVTPCGSFPGYLIY